MTRSLKVVKKWKVVLLVIVFLLGITGRPDRAQAQNYSAGYGSYGGYGWSDWYSYGSDCICDAVSYLPSFGSCNRIEIDDKGKIADSSMVINNGN